MFSLRCVRAQVLADPMKYFKSHSKQEAYLQYEKLENKKIDSKAKQSYLTFYLKIVENTKKPKKPIKTKKDIASLNEGTTVCNVNFYKLICKDL